ncbi:AMP-binding protein [Streptomyces sp. NPDC048606]|uniref:AMP-binding protein n=1 Tax=Streptomyces sp. NPDC048606 TaxID=3154726 RepID=UPI003421A04A
MTQAPPSARPDRPSVDTVVHRFERHVRGAPESLALVHGGRRLTYGQLGARVDRLALRIAAAEGLAVRERPAPALVAIGTARHDALVVALLAVLKAGATYAIVDAADAHTGRRQLAALAPHLLLTDGPGRAGLDDGHGHGPSVLLLDAADDDPPAPPGPPRPVAAGAPGASPVPAARPGEAPGGPSGGLPTGPSADPPAVPFGDPPAAVLLAGSADPRPVAVGHRLLLAALDGWTEVARLAPDDRHLFTGPPDALPFAAGWTRALCTGGALVLPDPAERDPAALADTVRAEGVTVVHTDPGRAARLTAPAGRPPYAAPARRAPDERLRSLRLLAVTGDRLYLDEQIALQDRLRVGARVLNVYALTETAGVGTFFEPSQPGRPLDDPERLSLLGTPFPGCRVHVHDGQLHLAPPDGSDALPTGDLGRLRPDGLLEFGGRLRDRVTLDDGTRLDPYTVESEIRAHPGFGGAVVRPLPLPAGARTTLAAYVTPTPDNPGWARVAPSQDLAGLRAHLADRIPPPAIPRRLVRLRTLPRDRGGREDRGAVPRPPAADPSTGAKYGAAPGDTGPLVWGCLIGLLMIPAVVVVLVATRFVWPGSTGLSGVPGPWAHLFVGLYVCEAWAFVYGLAFLLWGKRTLRVHGRGEGLTTTAHLAVSYLLIAWWPQDNLYRLASRTDWPHQAALVYLFNIPLMIAGFLVIRFLTWRPPSHQGRVEED